MADSLAILTHADASQFPGGGRHQGFRGCGIFLGITCELGPEADQFSSVPMALKNLYQDHGFSYFLTVQEIHQPGEASNPIELPRAAEGILQGRNGNFRPFGQNQTHGLEYLPVRRVNEIFRP